MTHRRTSGFALLGAMFLASVASAEVPGYAVNPFNPSERGGTFFSQDSLDLRGNGRLALGIVGDYSFRALTHRDGGVVVASPLRDQVQIHFGASVNLVDRLRLSINVPLQARAFGNSALIGGTTYAGAAEEVGVGDVRVGLDARLFGKHGDVITAAIGTQLFAPSGSPGSFAGDGMLRVMPKFAVAGTAGRFSYASHVGVMIRGRDEPYGNGYVGTELRLGAAGYINLLDDAIAFGPELIASTVLSDSRAFGAMTTPVEGILGGRAKITPEVHVGIGAGFGFTQSYGAPRSRVLLSLQWVAADPAEQKDDAAADADKDGVSDVDDACRYAPGPKSTDKTVSGCPIADTDGDGIADELDACRCVRGVASSDPVRNGCPADDDGDGIPNDVDACIDVAGKASADPKQNGCPERDTDGDKILDNEDACPDKAGVRTLTSATNGCPETDRDRDRVPNEVDACPDVPGPKNDDPKRNGCPRAYLKGDHIQILDQVKFATGSTAIAPGNESEEVLEAVLHVLKENPEITKVRVEGHTDNVGNAAVNKALSAGRAVAVVKWLGKHGIARELLTAVGVGSERPLEPNDTDAGKKANRRVEFHVEIESMRTRIHQR